MNSYGNSRLATALESFLLATNAWLGIASRTSVVGEFAIGFSPMLPLLDVQKWIGPPTKLMIPQGYQRKELGELPSSSQFWSTANSGDSLGDRVSGLGVVGQIQAHLFTVFAHSKTNRKVDQLEQDK